MGYAAAPSSSDGFQTNHWRLSNKLMRLAAEKAARPALAAEDKAPCRDGEVPCICATGRLAPLVLVVNEAVSRPVLQMSDALGNVGVFFSRHQWLAQVHLKCLAISRTPYHVRVGY
ncbi:hypothetical protein CPAR01_05070 [Colletotrichum paranaense]|uniref:Uncharacterized protein n=1 Tax=Colletotrichum paranaense TaxID=1914294 RepID=A0ABQ9SQ82_9PEZI|nr:uncharacterized protein CPAR01_05070 [Colletotrichum paranaense]KAK1541683.1 hypothetical protein CPAR01_05070 [Colletotrichum paranaense]